MSGSTITWGVCRDNGETKCTVFCYVCREVYGRELTTREASELKSEIDGSGHICTQEHSA